LLYPNTNFMPALGIEVMVILFMQWFLYIVFIPA
jgi:hypothetical protein